MKSTNQKYAAFKTHAQKIADLGYAGAVLSWDQQTYMPKNGANFRAQQMATLQTMGHELIVDEKFGKILEELTQDEALTEEEKVNVRLSFKDYSRKKKYPHEFVEEYAQVCSGAFGSWHEARSQNQFSLYEPTLKKIVELKRREVEFLGYDKHPYEALLEDFEPGLTVQKIDEVFGEVKRDLFPFVKKLAACEKPKADFLRLHYPKAKQWNFTEKMLKQMGYDFNSGRADFAPHPFCTTFGPGDVRITLRVHENQFNQMFFAAIHEAGHASYEMGLPMAEHYGLPLGNALSLAFHESQSRFWENSIARSLTYWKGNMKHVKAEFPENLGQVSEMDFYKAINRVEPSFIRVEADELTYHAHIYIRYLIEKALLVGEIETKDLPAFWNDRYEEYLGIRPPNDSLGCLQDVHWSYGSFGYFPTYSFGSFYAAQFLATMKKEVPDFDGLVAAGNLAPVMSWLREKFHVHGRKFNSEELLTATTGSGLKFSHFMDYAKKKYGEIYGL